MTVLVPIGGGHQLAPAPAASWLRAVAAGCPQTITSSYRDPAKQERMRAQYLIDLAAWNRHPVGKKPTYVAAVGNSEHVTGNALDLQDPAIAWMHAHPGFGWVFTDPTERWHVAYRAARDVHEVDRPVITLPDLPVIPTLPTLPDLPPIEEEDVKDLILACYRRISLYTPTDDELADVQILASGMTRPQVVAWFWSQPVAARTISALYLAFIGRAPTEAEVAGRLALHQTNRVATDAIWGSEEAKRHRGES